MLKIKDVFEANSTLSDHISLLVCIDIHLADVPGGNQCCNVKPQMSGQGHLQ
jgi:hypothetical protein